MTPKITYLPFVITVKHDCVFGEDLDLNEIKTVSEVRESITHYLEYLVLMVFGG